VKRSVRWSLVLAGALMGAPASARSADTLSVRAEAGLGGLVKSDRWVPVRIAVESAGPDAVADLEISWGDARVSRRVALASAGSRAMEIYVRTSHGESAVRVALRSDGRERHAVDVPVRVLDQDEMVTICIVPSGTLDAPGCSAVLTPDTLPTSPRGYEAADAVIWPAGDVPLPRDRRDALEQWHALRALDRSGDLSLTPGPTRPSLGTGLPADTARRVTVAASVYAVCLLLTGLIAARLGASWAFAALMLMTSAGAAGAAWLGRLGPGHGIQLHHTSLLQQIPGTRASMLTSKGIAVFPALDAFQIELGASDSAVETAAAAGPPVQQVNEAGHPVLSGRFGLGARQPFAIEGIVRTQLLELTFEGTRARATNLIDRPLHDCRFGDGFEPRGIGHLPPGATAEAEQTGEGQGPVLTCRLAELPVPMMDSRYRVQNAGLTTVAVYRGMAARQAAAGRSHD
jgi:hypothetical protein